MTEDDAKKRKLWSYVQNGMDPKDRADMEKSMEEDDALFEDVDKAKLADKYYRVLLPHMDLEPAELERTILGMWEQSDEHLEWTRGHEAEGEPVMGEGIQPVGEPDDFHKSDREQVPKERARRKPLSVAMFRPWMAMAACLLVLLGVHHVTLPDSLHWMAPELATWKQRGVDPSSSPLYRSEDLADFSDRLAAAVEDAYLEHRERPFWSSWVKRSSEWTLLVRVHELHNGLLKVEVEVEASDGERAEELADVEGTTVDTESLSNVQTWSDMFESKEAADREIDGFGKRVGAELAQKRRAP